MDCLFTAFCHTKVTSITRIRLVSEPNFASGPVSGFTKIARAEGLGAFYSGFGPILFKQ